MDVEIHDRVLVRTGPTVQPKTSVALKTKFYSNPPPPKLSTAIMFKRASLFPIECATPQKVRDVDFVWVHSDFVSKIGLGELLADVSRCATESFRWTLADRLVRPLRDLDALRDIAARVTRTRALIKRNASNPRAMIYAPTISDSDDFITKCVKMTRVHESVSKLHEWGAEFEVPDWPDWMEFAENPVHESIDAQITVVCGCDSERIIWDKTENEFVRADPREGWTKTRGGFTCPRLRELNQQRKTISKSIEKQFDRLYALHGPTAKSLVDQLVRFDEECFYAAFDYDYPEFGNEVVPMTKMTPTEIARAVYLAQCGFPVPLRTTRMYGWFDVSESEPNDGMFSFTVWADVRAKFVKKWGEPFVL